MAQGSQILGVFPYLDDVLRAIRAAREAKVRVHTVYSPTPCREIQEALGVRPSPVRFFTLLGGILGLTGGLSLAVFTVLQWNFITGGKPIVAFIPFVVVGFEMTILLGFLFTLVGMLLNNRMPRFRLPEHYDPRFSEDRFGVLVTCPDGRVEEALSLLRESGAEDVHEVRG